MELNYFDLAVGAIILFLGLKGVINGFFKEVFGIVGIVGGIFIASRLGDSVGQYLSDLIFMFESQSAISFTGFIATLLLFWLVMIFVGLIFKKLSSMSGLSPLDRLFGFIFGASKFFLIAAVIAHAVYNIKSIRTTIDPMLKTSVLFPVLVKTGSYIMKLDPVILDTSLNETVNKTQKSISQGTGEIAQNIKNDILKDIPEAAKELQKEESEH
jgi:membrane protein required for colicin V production